MQTDAACEVEILGARERTWCVDGLHFALVAVEGLTPDVDHPYEVRLDGEVVWPEAGAPFPASTIRLVTPEAPREIVFGSCRTALPHEPPYVLRKTEDERGHGIDALRAYALRAAARAASAASGGEDRLPLPDLLLMLGDQVYADEPSPQLKAALAARAHERPADAPPDERPAYANQINQIGTLTLDGDRARVSVEAVVDGTWRDPQLSEAFARELAG